jgi:CheY-like chemotaxis protein
VIEGSLRSVPLADVFQVVVTGGSSGVLTVERADRVAKLYFEGGRIQYARMLPGIHLGEVLVRMDLLTAREVQEIVALQAEENAGAPLGHAAVRLGLIAEDDLSRALERQVVEILGDVVTWRDGAFRLSESDVVRTYVPTTHGIDALSALLRAAGAGSGAMEHDAVPAMAADPSSRPLPPGGWEVIAAVDGRRSARSIAAEVDLPERETLELLAELERLGVIGCLPEPPVEPLVLVVSRSEAMQRLLRLTVERVGARVAAAGDDEAMAAAVARERPRAAIVDDTGEGWSRARSLRRLPGVAHVPLLVLGSAEAGLLARLVRPRSDTLPKPFDELALQEWLARRLGLPIT